MCGGWCWVVVGGGVESEFRHRLWPRPGQTIKHKVRWCQPWLALQFVCKFKFRENIFTGTHRNYTIYMAWENYFLMQLPLQFSFDKHNNSRTQNDLRSFSISHKFENYSNWVHFENHFSLLSQGFVKVNIWPLLTVFFTMSLSLKRTWSIYCN